MGYKFKKFIQLWSLRKPLRRDAFPQHIRINNHSLIKKYKNTYQFPNIVIFIIRQSKINIEDYSLINISLLSPLKYPRCGVTQKITNFLTKMFSNEKNITKLQFGHDIHFWQPWILQLYEIIFVYAKSDQKCKIIEGVMSSYTKTIQKIPLFDHLLLQISKINRDNSDMFYAKTCLYYGTN